MTTLLHDKIWIMNNVKKAEDFGVLRLEGLEGFRGSQAHGTYIPSDDPNSIDDIDYMGIYVKQKNKRDRFIRHKRGQVHLL